MTFRVEHVFIDLSSMIARRQLESITKEEQTEVKYNLMDLVDFTVEVEQQTHGLIEQ